MKLGTILATDYDELQEFSESTPVKLEMQENDVLSLAFKVDSVNNPKGNVKYCIKKTYGHATVYISESSKRPTATHNSYQS